MDIKKFTRISMFLALAVVLNLIESFIPLFNGFLPGVKLGLANTITLSILYIYGFKDALYLSILRVFLVGILRTGIFSIPFFFSLSGSLFSIIVMAIVKKIKIFSIIGISILGSISHSIGQIVVATFILSSTKILFYFPYLILFSIPTGIIVGIISKELIDFYKKI